MLCTHSRLTKPMIRICGMVRWEWVHSTTLLLSSTFYEFSLSYCFFCTKVRVSVQDLDTFHKTCISWDSGHDLLKVRWCSFRTKKESCELIYPREGNKCNECFCFVFEWRLVIALCQIHNPKELGIMDLCCPILLNISVILGIGQFASGVQSLSAL